LSISSISLTRMASAASAEGLLELPFGPPSMLS